ncbi:hypothetical protein [Levilactobacillus wangkuiensis]|uniref:hypothetical protein n=1 Tax=Levilactobacillus wangkuiensis TaxID=2799566 RepID=UPI00194FCBAF|nr:hypothetical protein [Levilactobacillus wangkuiensis]
MKKQLSDKEKAKMWDDLPNYITVNQPNGELIAYIPLKPESGFSDGMIVNKDCIFTESYSKEEAHFADIDGKVYYEGAMTWGNHKQAQEVVDRD